MQAWINKQTLNWCDDDDDDDDDGSYTLSKTPKGYKASNWAFKDICYGSHVSSVLTYLLHDVFVINVTNDVINYDYVIRIHS